MFYTIGKILAISIFLIVFLLSGLLLYRSLFLNKHVVININKEKYTETLQNDKREDSKDKEIETFWQRTVSEPISFYTFVLAIFTGLLALVAVFQIAHLIRSNTEATKAANAAEKAANAAIASNEISRGIMIAEQRPWIAVEVNVAGPLAYDAKGWDAGVRWHIPLKYNLRNLGKTPATNVSFFAEIIPYVIPCWPAGKIKDGKPQGESTPGTDIIEEIKNICGFPDDMSSLNMGWGTVVFPEERIDGEFGLNGNPGRFDEVRNALCGYTGQFLVVVCVSYGSTYTDTIYRTAKSFNLYKRTSDGRINLAGENIPLEGLALTRYPEQKGIQIK